MMPISASATRTSKPLPLILAAAALVALCLPAATFPSATTSTSGSSTSSTHRVLTATDVSSSCPSVASSTRFDPGAVPTALASYPGSGSTLTRILVELSTGVWTGSPYNDPSLLSNPTHPFLGESTMDDVVAIKTHYPWRRDATQERVLHPSKELEKAVIILRDPWKAIPSYYNWLYGRAVGDQHGVQAPEEKWLEFRTDGTAVVQKEMDGWTRLVRFWSEKFDDRDQDKINGDGHGDGGDGGNNSNNSNNSNNINGHPHRLILRYEDLVSRDLGAQTLQRLASYLGHDMPLDEVRCVWEEVMGAKSDGVRRKKLYTPGFTTEQEGIMRDGLMNLVAWAEARDDTELLQLLEPYVQAHCTERQQTARSTTRSRTKTGSSDADDGVLNTRGLAINVEE